MCRPVVQSTKVPIVSRNRQIPQYRNLSSQEIFETFTTPITATRPPRLLFKKA